MIQPPPLTQPPCCLHRGLSKVQMEPQPCSEPPVNITDLRKNSEQDKRFTFIRSDSGPTTSFESAACPGWFLCTALEADQPVGLTNTPKAAVKVTKFYFQQDQ